MEKASSKKSFMNSKAVLFFERALSSYFFPVLSAAVVLTCYYLGLDIVTVLYLCLSATAILIFCKDVTPVISLLLFMNVMISVKNSPTNMAGGGSDYFNTPIILALSIAGVSAFGVALFARLFLTIKNKKFKITPVFYGIFLFSASLLVNGLMNPQYALMNLVYGLGLAAILTLVFVFISANVKVDGKTFIKISYYLIALFAVLLVELVVKYATTEGIISGGAIMRYKLFFGWGTYNNMGALLVMTIPAWFYLAGKYKYGMPFLFGAMLNLGAAFFCMSRQAALMSVVIFILGIIWLLVWRKGTYRLVLVCAIIFGVALLTVCLGILDRYLVKLFKAFYDSLDTGSGRTILWEQGIRKFLDHPVTGVGFYDPAAHFGQPGYYGDTLSYSIPKMCHNTFIQLLCAGGAVAFAAYVFHRLQTVYSYLKNVTAERTFMFLAMLALLLTSLLDNHIFYILPTLAYTVFVALLSATEEKTNKIKKIKKAKRKKVRR